MAVICLLEMPQQCKLRGSVMVIIHLSARDVTLVSASWICYGDH